MSRNPASPTCVCYAGPGPDDSVSELAPEEHALSSSTKAISREGRKQIAGFQALMAEAFKTY